MPIEETQEDSTQQSTLSVYERWSWKRCQHHIRSLKHRLGYEDKIWVLGFNVCDNGCIVDPFHQYKVFDPSNTSIPWSVPYHSMAIAEMLCLLTTYAHARDISLTGKLISARALDALHRFTVQDREVQQLLDYRELDFHALKTKSSFFSETLEYGDFAFILRPLPRIPVSIILWEGNHQVPSGCSVLFDTTITHYLPNLAIELAGLSIWRLRNILDATVKWGYTSHHTF